MRWIEGVKRRAGLLLGGLLCTFVVGCSQSFIFSVEYKGVPIYKREIRLALAEAGISPFLPYPKGREDVVCAKILALDGVEFCSVKKEGYRVVVELHTSPFPEHTIDRGVMQAKRDGKIVAMTVLRGTPLKTVGDVVRKGEPLVENTFTTEEGGHVRVEIIARVRIACAWEGLLEASSEEEAFAKAYLLLDFSDCEELKRIQIVEEKGLYRVAIEYDSVQKINF